MSIELRPLGVNCNIHCQYCYQNPQRDAGNVADQYDVDRMLEAVEAGGGQFTLFGGEPLMVPIEDLERLWAWGFQRNNQNGVQTNGTLITDDHIRLFKQYKVFVGMSVDGPGELNDVRWAGTLEKTRELTSRTHEAIERLCTEGIPPSLIVTLHRANATPDKLPRMHDWLRYVESLGVTSARIHILEVDNPLIEDKYALSNEENLEAFLSFARLEEDQLTTLHLDVFQDMRNLLLGTDGSTTCVWNACDPYTTAAVQGVEGDGQRSNCGRTNKDGIDFTKSETDGYERYMALYQTPQEHGGCQGCRFFLMCKGQCPGTSILGEWRNRTEHCEVWKGLYRHLEEKLLEENLQPISVRPERARIEGAFMETWTAGQNTTMQQVLHSMDPGHSSGSGSYTGPGFGGGHGDIPASAHGDHSDAAPHGDHNDAAH